MKKVYVTPELKVFELRPEERFAANSNNCAATQGVGQGCVPAANAVPSGGNIVP